MVFDIASFLRILEMVGPLALTAAGVPPLLIPLIVHGIGIAEQAVGPGRVLTGAEKKAIAMDAIVTGVSGVNAAKPGLLVPGYSAVASSAIDTTVALVNLIKAQVAHGQSRTP